MSHRLTSAQFLHWHDQQKFESIILKKGIKLLIFLHLDAQFLERIFKTLFPFSLNTAGLK
jgi:hypothetical protein